MLYSVGHEDKLVGTNLNILFDEHKSFYLLLGS